MRSSHSNVQVYLFPIGNPNKVACSAELTHSQVVHTELLSFLGIDREALKAVLMLGHARIGSAFYIQPCDTRIFP